MFIQSKIEFWENLRMMTIVIISYCVFTAIYTLCDAATFFGLLGMAHSFADWMMMFNHSMSEFVIFMIIPIILSVVGLILSTVQLLKCDTKGQTNEDIK